MDPKEIAAAMRTQLAELRKNPLVDFASVRTGLAAAVTRMDELTFLQDGGLAETLTVAEQLEALALLVEGLPPGPAPAPGPVIHYRNQFIGGKHASWVNGFGMGEAAPGAGGTIAIEPWAPAPSGYCLNFRMPGGPLWQDNRMEQRFRTALGRRYFIGLTLDVDPLYVHRDAEGPDNNKQLRLWAGPYERNLTVGFSLLPTSSGISKLIIETICATATGGSKYPVQNKGPYTYCMRPGTRQRFGFLVERASGLGKKDGMIDLWSNGIRTTADTFVTLPDGTRKQTVFERDFRNLDLWSEYNRINPGAEPVQDFGEGFFPGWSNSGFNVETNFRYIDFVIADNPLPEYTNP
jgi:hypothetical protein